MSKPRKVQEPAGTYTAKKSAPKATPAPKAGEQQARYIDDATFRKAADKVFAERKNLLRKLAQ